MSPSCRNCSYPSSDCCRYSINCRTVREVMFPRSTTSRRVISSGFLGGPARREGTGGG